MNPYPHWFPQVPAVGQLPIGLARWNVWNRTGGATVKGNVYQFDFGLTTTSLVETQPATGNLLPAVLNYNWRAPDSCWRNIVTPVSAYLRQAVFCMAESAVADNEELSVLVVGPATLKACTTAVGDGTITAGGQRFEPQNASGAPLYTVGATTSRLIFLNTSSFVIAGSAIATVDGMFNGFGF